MRLLDDVVFDTAKKLIEAGAPGTFTVEHIRIAVMEGLEFAKEHSILIARNVEACDIFDAHKNECHERIAVRIQKDVGAI